MSDRLKLACQGAARQCPQLKTRRISPHIVRHATAMSMLQSGAEPSIIALWLGHEDPATTHMYVEADLAMKRRALDKLSAAAAPATSLRPTDRVLNSSRGFDYVRLSNREKSAARGSCSVSESDLALRFDGSSA